MHKFKMAIWAGLFLAGFAFTQEPGQVGKGNVTLQVTGLFAEERVDDLKKVMQNLPNLRLLNLKYSEAQATLEYSGKELVNLKADQLQKRLDELLKNASRHTFGLKNLPSLPMAKMKRIEIQVEGLDCKGCALAAYEAVAKVEGVERATASFKKGLVTALIDPEKTDRSKLEKALKAREVKVKENP